MAHQRKTIRDAVASVLSAGNTIVAAGKVYSNRGLNVWAEDLPVVNVTTDSETAEVFETCNKKYQRDLTIVIEAVATQVGDATIDDTLDDLADKIERAMKADATWNGTVFDSSLTTTTLSIDADGEKFVGRAQLTYSARYYY